MENEVVDEILDEESEFVSDLNETMQHVNQATGNDAIEEDWLKIMVDFHGFYGPRTNRWLLVKEDLGARSGVEWVSHSWDPSRVRNRHGLRLIQRYSPSAASERWCWIDEEHDQYLKANERAHSIPRVRIYAEWVEYFYNNQALHDYPRRIDEEWYKDRKYWATRQAEVLDGIS